jgi:amino acid adenylation domain-containing protein
MALSLLHGAFEQHARSRPDAPALVIGRQRISYGELDDEADRLAQYLRSLGIGPGDRVALCVGRVVHLYVGLLGILKSGAAYVPLDPTLPEERRGLILDHSHARAILTFGEQEPAGPVRQIDLQRDAEAIAAQRAVSVDAVPSVESEAYLIYTSGTTGGPKGVAIRHGQVADRVATMATIFGLQQEDRVLQFASIMYDAAVEQIFTTLSSGALLVARTETWSIDSLLELLKRERVTMAQFTSTVWEALTQRLIGGRDADQLSLTRVVLAGEAVDPSTVALWFRHYDIPLLNVYGPTETTISATVHRLSQAEDPVLIGEPVPGVHAHVMDNDGRAVEPGEVGELWLSGPGTAHGYLDRPELTSERFVDGPDGRRAYRTGDRVRVVGGQALEFLGRLDDQVQIGGVRIEPGEVASVLREHVQIAQAHVEARKHRSIDVLVAHVVPMDHRQIPTARQLRDFLGRRLPAPFVPSYFTILDQLPVLPNGKTDRRALQDIEIAPPEPAGDYAEPTPGVEERLAALWAEELGVDRVGADDDLLNLGAHSLRTMRIAVAIARDEGVDLSTAELYSAPTVRAQARLIDTRRQAPRRFPPIARRSVQGRIPMSEQQKQIWFLNRLDPTDASYRFQAVVSIAGRLDLQIVDQVVTALHRRHPVLRTTYSEDADGFWQHIHEAHPVAASYVDLRGLPESERSAAAQQVLRDSIALPMPLDALPLQVWTVIQAADDAFELVLLENHMVHDGWSFALLMNEFAALYNANQSGGPAEVVEQVLDYGDYALWQAEQLRSGSAFASQLRTWQKRFRDRPAVVSLHPDLPRPARMRHEGAVLRIDLPGSLPDRLRAFCRDRRVTVFETLFSTFCIFLMRHTQQTDITVASAFANRRVPETQHLLGMFVNTVLLRIAVDPDATFDQILRRVQDELGRAIDNQEAPFPEVVRGINPERSAAANPLTNVMFSAHDSAIPEMQLGDAVGTISYPSNNSSKQELSIILLPARESQIGAREINDQRITMEWEYNSALFHEESVSRMATRYIHLLEVALHSPGSVVTQMPLSGEPDIAAAPVKRQPPSVGAPAETWTEGIAIGPVAVAHWASTTPQAIALRDHRGTLTYAELDAHSRALAAELLWHGLRHGDRVVALVDDVRGRAIATLAVHAAGLAMVTTAGPLSEAALSAVLEGSAYVLCSPSTVHLVEDRRVAWSVVGAVPAVPIPVAAALPAKIDGADVALVLTEAVAGSDSTSSVLDYGRLSSLLRWSANVLPIQRGASVAAFAAPDDARAVWEMLRTFVAGATLVVSPDADWSDADAVCDWLLEQHIGHCTLPGRVATYLVRHRRDSLPDLVWLGSTGDRLHVDAGIRAPFTIATVYAPLPGVPVEALQSWKPGAELVGIGRSVSVGPPVPGVSLRVVDRWGQIAPPNVPGEIWIAREQRASREFVYPTTDVRANGVPTGDAGYQSPNGMVELIGPAATRASVKGYVVALDEIEAALRDDRDVRDCAVITQSASDPSRDASIIAFVVLGGGSRRGGSDLLRGLRDAVPDFMVPSEIVIVPRIPLTATGSVDAAALEKLFLNSQAEGSGMPEQSAGLEDVIAALWADALQIDHVGHDDNFFDLGGHSLLATQVINQVHDRVNVRLELREIYEAPTVRAMADLVLQRFVSSIREPAVKDGRGD